MTGTFERIPASVPLWPAHSQVWKRTYCTCINSRLHKDLGPVWQACVEHQHYVALSLSCGIIGSAEVLPILCVRYFWWERERERERYRERERDRRKWRHHCRAILARQWWRWTYTFPCHFQLAMSLHFPLPKIRTFRFSLHTSRLSLHGEVTMVALKFAMSSHFPLPKHFSPSAFVLPLGTSRTTSARKPKTNDQILPSPILFFPSKNWIKLIPKTIGNRKRDCAWGGSGW